MTELRDVLAEHTGGPGQAPGAVALVARGEDVLVEAVGSADAPAGRPMRRDSIFRLASATKPITATAVLMLITDGLLALDDPIARWLPELAAPSVLRTPGSQLDDTVPIARPITVFDLLTFRAGWGITDDFSLPGLAPLLAQVQPHARDPQAGVPVGDWLVRLAAVPMLGQPGEAWLYNTCSDIQGALIERVTGSFPGFLADRVFAPLGMTDTSFVVPADKLDRFTSYYQATPDGDLDLLDEPDGQWAREPLFYSGAGGLATTVDDWLRFARLLLARGEAEGKQLVAADLVRELATDQLTVDQRAASRLFLEGQGWGFGGSVDVVESEQWNVPGRYGWVGGTGTVAHLVPSSGLVAIMFSQLAMTSPSPTAAMRAFWRAAS